MAVVQDSISFGRSKGRQTPPVRQRRHVTTAAAGEVDAVRRSVVDMSRAIHQFMQIDDKAFCRALSRVNQPRRVAMR